MKLLYVVRHAKSSWKFSDLEDIYRPLKGKGYRNALEIAERTVARQIRPDLIISSPAIRAYSTALIFAGNTGYDMNKIQIRSSLYESSVNTILTELAAVPNDRNAVMIFGHHPSFTDLCLRLGGEGSVPSVLPTGAIAGLELAVDRWEDIANASGKILFMLRPERSNNKSLTNS